MQIYYFFRTHARERAEIEFGSVVFGRLVAKNRPLCFSVFSRSSLGHLSVKKFYIFLNNGAWFQGRIFPHRLQCTTAGRSLRTMLPAAQLTNDKTLTSLSCQCLVFLRSLYSYSVLLEAPDPAILLKSQLLKVSSPFCSATMTGLLRSTLPAMISMLRRLSTRRCKALFTGRAPNCGS